MHNKLRKMKESAHMSTKELSKKSGVPEATISRILSGQTENPYFYNVRDIVVAMDGSVDDVIGNKIVSPEKTDALIELYEKNLAHERKTTKMLAIVIAVIFAIILLVLIYDILHPNIGYFVY